jgi:xylan 1,4-beta-xylosidase
MLSVQGDSLAAVVWDFEQPIQDVSNHPFYTKLLPSHPAAPVLLRVRHLRPGAIYRLAIHRTGYKANDAYSAYLELGSPKVLSPEQVARLNALTRDLPERDEVVTTDASGALSVSVSMRSNDIVLVTLNGKGTKGGPGPGR